MPRGGKREGAGRKAGVKIKRDTVTYYRSVYPEWVPILDKKLEELKMIDKEKTEERKRIIKLIGNLLLSEVLEQAVKDDWCREEERLSRLRGCCSELMSKAYKDIGEDIMNLWGEAYDLTTSVGLSDDTPELIELQQEEDGFIV